MRDDLSTGNQSTANGNPPQASAVMLSGDLMFASRVRAAAQSAGLNFLFGGNLPDGDLSQVRFVILDLSTRSGLVPSIVGSCRERCPGATLIAYGPHVQVDRLREARDAGIPNVLTNGQFHAQLAQLFS